MNCKLSLISNPQKSVTLKYCEKTPTLGTFRIRHRGVKNERKIYFYSPKFPRIWFMRNFLCYLHFLQSLCLTKSFSKLEFGTYFLLLVSNEPSILADNRLWGGHVKIEISMFRVSNRDFHNENLFSDPNLLM